ncbi:tRNA (adenosine(37)-N6)-threonylcarbamoyltransferase complex ATPase subunit type 1 TsaE [Flavobacteriales bacterium]|jgi:tRNA threonylcarbamoyladenosine biosynthesis protein TsaE|nr:tRNA (adenosine(37)-N6)-threonylcarbamoyltransferase complex ATPase subunit type 1 TsaE [Flavobacteriales bacterium]
MKIIVNCISELKSVALQLIQYKKNKNIICFYGEMGVGKTTFIKEICKNLLVDDNVSSPTFSIVNQYKTKENKIIYHFDFYRLETEEEAYDMGYEEYFFQNDLCLIEWPEKIEGLIPEDIIKVILTKKGEQRLIEII